MPEGWDGVRGEWCFPKLTLVIIKGKFVKDPGLYFPGQAFSHSAISNVMSFPFSSCLTLPSLPFLPLGCLNSLQPMDNDSPLHFVVRLMLMPLSQQHEWLPGLCSRSAQVPQVTNLCLWVTRKTYFFQTSVSACRPHDFMVRNVCAPCNFS